MAGHTRSRTGCWTCREAGYKCDEQKPSCGRCTRLKKECRGYGVKLRWKIATSAAAPRKRTAKRRQSVSMVSVDSPTFTTSPLSVFRVFFAPTPASGSSCHHYSERASSPTMNPSIYPDLSHTNQRLLHYWLKQLAPLISAVPKDGGTSSFQIHLASMTYTRGALQSTVLSMAATHFGLVSGDTKLRLEAYKHQHEAIQLLQEAIQDPYQADADPTLATVMMMQISARLFGDEEEAHAANHLTGAKAMISRRRARSSSTSSSAEFLNSLYAYHDILSSVSRGSSPLDAHGSEFTAIEGSAKMSSIAKVLQVVAHISKFHDAAKAERLLLKSSDLHGDNFNLGAQLQQTLLNLAFDLEMITPDISFTAEAYRHAAFIYLYRVWLDMGSPNPTTLKHVQECLAYIEQVPVDSQLASSHVWPLFTAGCEAMNATQRIFVRERFQAMYELRKFPSLKRVLRDIEDVWAVKDAEQMGGLKVDCIQVILRRRGREVDLA
ncbi:fungal Zn binuclear cluster domain containing protein [Paraphaeosphaeria minitans]|uniref:Fungal Zn binuclear cluster domain containing protein n=1 Tax=Paraphaeosphaeria minitans TaxID=565426 RepID=A0A9P6GNF9_9PLEO|nr:fungal Zn binuclear cluster domain containing protein [Paraphaeosphaeria minitans]